MFYALDSSVCFTRLWVLIPVRDHRISMNGNSPKGVIRVMDVIN
jgi:hypothetical protein